MQKKLNIIHVTNNYTPYSGGVVSSINTTCTALQELGHQIKIVTLDFGTQEKKDFPWVTRIACPITFKYKTNHMAVPFFLRHFFYDFFSKNRPNIVHVHHPFLLGFAACNIAQEMDIPVVFTHHTLYEHYAHYVPFPEQITKLIINKRVIQFCNGVNTIIAPSSSVKKILQKNKIKKPIVVLPTALPQSFFLPKFSYKEKKKRFNLLYLGRFTKEKNVSFLLDAIAQLDQQEYMSTFVGYGNEYNAIKDYAYNHLKLSSRSVQFIHKPKKEELTNFYRQADLFIFSSKTDTQGLVLQESMAAGTPIVALNGPAQQDCIQHAKNGLLVEDKQSFLTAIKKIAAQPIFHKKMQYEAWSYAQKYQKQFILGSLINLYESLI